MAPHWNSVEHGHFCQPSTRGFEGQCRQRGGVGGQSWPRALPEQGFCCDAPRSLHCTNTVTTTEESAPTRSATIFCMYLVHFSTSFLGPLSWTMSLFCAGSGKLMITWKKSLQIQVQLLVTTGFRSSANHSLLEDSRRRWETLTSGNLSRISRIRSPFWPMMVRWNRCSMTRSLVRSFSWNPM